MKAVVESRPLVCGGRGRELAVTRSGSGSQRAAPVPRRGVDHRAGRGWPAGRVAMRPEQPPFETSDIRDNAMPSRYRPLFDSLSRYPSSRTRSHHDARCPAQRFRPIFKHHFPALDTSRGTKGVPRGEETAAARLKPVAVVFDSSQTQSTGDEIEARAARPRADAHCGKSVIRQSPRWDRRAERSQCMWTCTSHHLLRLPLNSTLYYPELQDIGHIGDRHT